MCGEIFFDSLYRCILLFSTEEKRYYKNLVTTTSLSHTQGFPIMKRQLKIVPDDCKVRTGKQ